MSKIKYILVLAILTTGCQDMKMDRKVEKTLSIGQALSEQLKTLNA
jgi:hypothetical protein